MKPPLRQLVVRPDGMLSVDPLLDAAWGDLLGRAPSATIFHHPGWLRLIRDQYGLSISAWCLTGLDGRLVAGIPVALLRSRLTGVRLIALPFSDSCPVLLDPAAGVEISGVARGVDDACEQLGLPLELREALPGSPGAIVVERYVQHQLALQPDVDRVIASFAKTSTLRGTAKARREGVTIDRRTDRAGLERFYRLHTVNRRRQGVPTQPKRFILGFGDLFDAGLGFVTLARYRERDIAAAVFLTAGQTMTYKFGASDRRFLSVRPNNLLFVEAIRWGCEHGLRVLDFGRTDHDNQGLRAFKSSWGATESPLAFTYFGGYNATLGAIPGRNALSTVIRHAPPSFGRLLGTALYRHFG